VIDARLKRRRDAQRPAEAPIDRRVRVTGSIS
jgi:hypothetical protein